MQENGDADYNAFEQRLATLLAHRLEQVGTVFGMDTLDTVKYYMPELELKEQESLFRRTIRTYIRDRALRVAGGIISGIRKRIQRVLIGQVNEGFGEREATRQVAQALGTGLARHIAQRIARTEAHNAASVGAYNAAKASGTDLVKEWGATEDVRTRETHARADHQTRELEDVFNVGNARLYHPGDPAGPPEEIINCRCVALYWPRLVAPYPVTRST